jgi:predicted nucleic acid-binding protein
VILVDTSVWRWALRRERPGSEQGSLLWDEARRLPEVLEQGLVVGHLWVQAELLLGGMPQGAIALYCRLPRSRPVGAATLVEVIVRTRPRGVGLVDLGLLSAALRDGLRLWTLDQDLLALARGEGIAWSP